MSENVKERIEQEDKKSIGKFILVLLCCVIVGFIGGFCSGYLTDPDTGIVQLFEKIGEKILEIAPYVYLAYGVIMAIIIIVRVQRDKKIARKWDGEDEDYIEDAERKLSIDLSIVEMSNIISMLLGAIAVYQSIDRGIIHVAIAMGTMLAYAFFSVEMEKTLVNLEKELNPEKRGSVLSSDFQKEWQASCDEAEILEAGKAALKAFGVMQVAAIVMIVIFTVWGMTEPIGLYAVVGIVIVWGSSALAYFIQCCKKR